MLLNDLNIIISYAFEELDLRRSKIIQRYIVDAVTA